MKIPRPITIISRDAAHALGFTRYYTGLPCKHGHIAERLIANTGCVECVYRKRLRVNPLTPSATTLHLDIRIDDPLPPEFMRELTTLIYGWVDHVMRERGYRKDIIIDPVEWVKR